MGHCVSLQLLLTVIPNKSLYWKYGNSVTESVLFFVMMPLIRS